MRPSSCRCGPAAFATCGAAARHGAGAARGVRAPPLHRPVAHRRRASSALRPDHDGAAHCRRRCCWRSALQPGQRVLEIGTGSGYVTALLARARRRGHVGRALQDAGGERSQHLKIVEARATRDRDRRWSGGASARSVRPDPAERRLAPRCRRHWCRFSGRAGVWSAR